MGALERWITGRLEGDAPLAQFLPEQPESTGGELGIFGPVAPEGALTPYVLIGDPAGGGDAWNSDGVTSYTRVLPVKVVDLDESAERAEAIENRIYTLLSGQVPVAAGFRFDILRRVGLIAYSEARDGLVYIHRGSRYGTLVIPTD